MSRLPVSGSDDGQWGNILNDYLLQSHNNDGTLKDGIVTSNTLADGSITSSKLASNSVSSAILQNNVITSTKVADGAITSGKLAPGITGRQRLVYDHFLYFMHHQILSTDNSTTTTPLVPWQDTTTSFSEAALKIAAAHITRVRLLSLRKWQPYPQMQLFGDTSIVASQRVIHRLAHYKAKLTNGLL